MSPVDAPAVTDDASVLRRSLVGLVVIAISGLTAELLVERHWGTPVRLVPWFALVALAYAALLLMRRPTAAAVRRARMLAGGVMIAAAVGVALHINENYVAGPLDQRACVQGREIGNQHLGQAFAQQTQPIRLAFVIEIQNGTSIGNVRGRPRR